MSPEEPAHGKLLIFTAPSGAGKTTLVRHLLARFGELAFSVSATTRPPRPGERDGIDYHFLTPEAFLAKVANDEFVEYEEVYPGRFYGTLHSEVRRIWAANRTVVFDIEVKGATAIKRQYPEGSLAVFVAPPSREILFQRLRDRSTEDPESLRVRIARAAEELAYADRFDRVLVNDDLQAALAEAELITRDFLNS
ncbi:guanylate kinase [Lewinella marina]|uniref:Guanylate kinase n=1 Tax=Neolewinella marina TaxID=438751 RepID=A0A2G0CJG1_9BACT|nr:guanylate kinase [Neolewinella marina]NJB84736.1 guanylate kinase [Neolewinella marina]PHL00105.1 guanylate kinase [Neolewinella marina]